jgi:ribosomal protein L11 methylase PrmA
MALDYDPLAVDAARANARVNGVDVDVRRHDLRADPLVFAPTIAANLLGPLLLSWARRLEDAPERLIASGLLVEEADQITDAFAAKGLHEEARLQAGEWAALLLRR